ncbi:MAG: hypothetical protein IPG43_04720 [Proteobacteria bacterium]|nr:hypothetical protein [Pseudomonadota bacterium]
MCSIRDDLVAGVERLLMSDPAPEQVLIETSGVSDPGNILCTLKESRVRRGIFLENVITVVDALHALDAREADYAALFERQLRAAYMLVLNRTQAAGEERTQSVRDMLAQAPVRAQHIRNRRRRRAARLAAWRQPPRAIKLPAGADPRSRLPSLRQHGVAL